MADVDRLNFGIFLAPFHYVADNPTLSLQRDLELIRWLDQLGYDEAWIGEHHSAGYQIIASPELFVGHAPTPPPSGWRPAWGCSPPSRWAEPCSAWAPAPSPRTPSCWASPPCARGR